MEDKNKVKKTEEKINKIKSMTQDSATCKKMAKQLTEYIKHNN